MIEAGPGRRDPRVAFHLAGQRPQPKGCGYRTTGFRFARVPAQSAGVCVPTQSVGTRSFASLRMTIFVVSIALLSLFHSMNLSAQQTSIPRIDLMPNRPSPYLMRNWKEVARGYRSEERRVGK